MREGERIGLGERIERVKEKKGNLKNRDKARERGEKQRKREDRDAKDSQGIKERQRER